MRRAASIIAATAALVTGPAAAAQAAVATEPDRAMPTFAGDVTGIAHLGSTVYVVGTFRQATTSSGSVVTRNRAAAFNANTGELLAWNPNANGAVNDIAVLPDGRIAIGGTFTRVKGACRANLAVVEPVTAAVTGFDRAVDGKVRALSVGPTGRLYVGGVFTQAGSVAKVGTSCVASWSDSRRGLAAYDGNTLNTDWNPTANGDKPAVIALEAANGVVYVGGKFTSIDNVSGSGYLASVHPDTGAVTSWNPSVNYTVNDIDTDPSTVYVAADGPGGHLRAQNASDGRTRWDLTADGGVQAVDVVGASVYFGGHFDHVCNTVNTGSKGVCLDGQSERRKLGLADAVTGGLDPAWAPRANSALGVHSIEDNGSKLGVGGSFTQINYRDRAGFAQFSGLS